MMRKPDSVTCYRLRPMVADGSSTERAQSGVSLGRCGKGVDVRNGRCPEASWWWRSRSPCSFELLAIAGSVLQKDVRLVALTGIGWIAAAGITRLLFFARRPVAYSRGA